MIRREWGWRVEEKRERGELEGNADIIILFINENKYCYTLLKLSCQYGFTVLIWGHNIC